MFSAIVKRRIRKEQRDDYRTGVLASALINFEIARNTPKGSKPKFLQAHTFFTLDVLFPKQKEALAEKQQSWEQQLAMVKALNAAFGGKSKNKRGYKK